MKINVVWYKTIMKVNIKPEKIVIITFYVFFLPIFYLNLFLYFI